ncbi:MAG: hypothetical protein GQ574_24415 [Crocinitomix sp.]|nr:hypothetical protein [Crocinitomix sp.]
MKLIFIIAISFLLPLQLFTQSAVEDPVPFSELKETEQETRSGGFINIYHHKGELFTGSAIEKKLTSSFLYHFKNGKRHGLSTHFTKANKEKKEWEYQHGMLRVVREWYIDGDLKNEIEFNRKSRFEKKSVWHRNGEIKETFKQRKYSPNQKVKRYSKKGNISEKGQETSIESGKKVETIKVGKWLYFDRKGKRKKIEVYDLEGKKISSKKI